MSLHLTREQRELLFARECPRISGEDPCPVEPGYVYSLSPLVSLKVLAVRRRRAGRWTLHYQLEDRRDPVRKLKPTPTVNFDSWRQADQYGEPREPTPDALRDAAIESAYTSAPTRLSEAGEAVDVTRFAKRAQENKAQQDLVNQLRREQYELEQRLARARQEAQLRGIDVSSTVRVIERQISKLERRLDGKAA